jgi:phage terminase small subunit
MENRRKSLTKEQALKKAGYVPVMGRPSIGSEMFPAITVPEGLREALEKKSAELGLSVPDARREAYRLFTK